MKMSLPLGNSRARPRPGARAGCLLLLLGACTSNFAYEYAPNGDAGSPGASGSAGFAGSAGSGSGGALLDCRVPNPGSAPLRRLSNAEYRNTVNDLFAGVADLDAVVTSATSEFPAEAESLGFHNSAQFLSVQPLVARKYMDAAEMIAERAARSPGVVPCTPAAGREMGCARAFIADLGARAYRRPLSADESAAYEAQFESTLSAYDFDTAVEWTIFGMLQAPSFLYRVEVGRESADNLLRPTSHELASRLSYLFWQSLPDAELLAAAANGTLDTRAGVEAQARRMLADPRSERLFQYFAEWLDLDRMQDFSRDEAVFANLPPDLPELYEDETRSFVHSLLTRRDGSFSELLTAPYTFANATLARHYGLEGPRGSSFVRVDAPNRSGILTQATLMAQDKPYRTSIVRRGLKLRTDFLCQIVPAPPNDVPLNLEAISPELSQRDRLAQHREDDACAGCHALLDPIGLVFESFDAVGRYRSIDEQGNPISTASEINATRDANGAVADVRELGARLAASSEARDCYVTQTFRFFFGREVEAADACSIAALREAFAAENFSISELLIALTRTDAFLYRPTTEETR